MVENAVVKEQLTDAMIEAGAELTRKLDESGVPINAALWLFTADSNEWRLLFASPDVSAQGSRMVYERIRLALAELSTKAAAAPLSAIGLLDPNAELIQLLKRVVRASSGIHRIRFSKNAINGRFIDDALIYRVA